MNKPMSEIVSKGEALDEKNLHRSTEKVPLTGAFFILNKHQMMPQRREIHF
jgi:hypothetical protein